MLSPHQVGALAFGAQFLVQCDRKLYDVGLLEQGLHAGVVDPRARAGFLAQCIEHLQDRRQFLLGQEVDLQIEVRASIRLLRHAVLGHQYESA